MAQTSSDPMRGRLFLAALGAALLVISCGNQVSPAPKPQVAPFEFLGAWGDPGSGPGKLDSPAAFATDTLGNVFFVDPQAGFVHKFESRGTPLFSFEEPRVRHAAGIAVDSGGAIYVADAEHGNILIFFPDGSFLRSMRSAPFTVKVHGEPQRHFSGPFGISVDEQGTLYVPDPAKSRVLKFDSRGRLAAAWPTSKNPVPSEEQLFSVAAAQDGTVFAAYSQTGRVERFSSDGSWMTTWAARGSSDTSTPLTGFAVAGEFVYTLAASSAEIRVWTFDGHPALAADLGANIGVIPAPQIAVTPHAELLVLNPSAPKVFRFRIHLEHKEPQ